MGIRSVGESIIYCSRVDWEMLVQGYAGYVQAICDAMGCVCFANANNTSEVTALFAWL